MKKILMIVGGVVVSIFALVAIIFTVVSLTSSKLVCESPEGNITLMYNSETITGYTAVGVSYELDEQKMYAKQVGIEAYLEEFSLWFSNNTSGQCVYKK